MALRILCRNISSPGSRCLASCSILNGFLGSKEAFPRPGIAARATRFPRGVGRLPYDGDPTMICKRQGDQVVGIGQYISGAIVGFVVVRLSGKGEPETRNTKRVVRCAFAYCSFETKGTGQ